MSAARDLAGFAFRTAPVADLTVTERAQVVRLFDACYRQANHAYLEGSLERLRYVSLALRDDEPIAFGLGDARVIDLPGLPGQTLLLGGLCCVSLEFRRRGLFGELQRRAILAAESPAAERVATCGRMAHAAAFRVMVGNPTAVPRPGVTPTPWQQQIGRVIADTYGVRSFDPQTFVCEGSGRPIGYPVMEVEVEPKEWEVFRPVNRERGDSLLGIAWSPDAPPGW